MNSATVSRIQDIDKQLAALARIRSDGSHEAAGLDITLQVGDPDDADSPDELRMSTGLGPNDELLTAIHDSLAAERAQLVAQGKAELQALLAFFQDGAPKTRG